MKTVDARGLSCPEPVMLMLEAIKSEKGTVEVIVDQTVSRDNVAHMAEEHGRKVKKKKKNGDYYLELS